MTNQPRYNFWEYQHAFGLPIRGGLGQGDIETGGESRGWLVKNLFQIILARGVNIWKLPVIVNLSSGCPAAQQLTKGGRYATRYSNYQE